MAKCIVTEDVYRGCGGDIFFASMHLIMEGCTVDRLTTFAGTSHTHIQCCSRAFFFYLAAEIHMFTKRSSVTGASTQN